MLLLERIKMMTFPIKTYFFQGHSYTHCPTGDATVVKAEAIQPFTTEGPLGAINGLFATLQD